jgi:tRNA-dihydrouridine synthase
MIMRLALMAGVTNPAFRLIARECGSGRVTSEEIDAREAAPALL